MKILVAFFVLSSSCFGNVHESWLDQVKKRTDQETIDWLREKLKQEGSQSIEFTNITKFPCQNCFSGGGHKMDPKIYVFMSFSVSEEAWLKLSSEMEKYSGVFVIRGLPNNSFQEFANRLVDLKMKGMRSDVQINPNLFKQYKVKEVPTFVFPNPSTLLTSHQEKEQFLKLTIYSGVDDWDKISGNISLSYALDVITKDLKPLISEIID